MIHLATVYFAHKLAIYYKHLKFVFKLQKKNTDLITTNFLVTLIATKLIKLEPYSLRNFSFGIHKQR